MREKDVPVGKTGETEVSAFRLVPDIDLPWLSEMCLPGTRFTEDWFKDINETITDGSESINPLHSTMSEVQTISRERQKFFDLLGFNNPRHELHATYRVLRSERPCGVPLMNFISAARLLASYGAPVCLAFKNMRSFFEFSPRAAAMKLSYLDRLKNTLDWQVDLGEVINQVQEALTHSRRRLGIIARLASMASAEQLPNTKEAAVLVRQVGRYGLEGYVYAAVNETLVLGTGLAPAPEIGRPQVIQLVHDELEPAPRRLLRDYFLYKKPTSKELQQYPQLSRYVIGREKLLPKLVLGHADQDWLAQFNNPEKYNFTLRRLIVRGSKSRNIQIGNCKKEQEKIYNARRQFLETLATSVNNPNLQQAIEKHCKSRGRLPPLDRMIKTFRVFAEKGIDIPTVLTKYIRIVTISSEKVRAVFKVLEMYGINPKVIASRAPITLTLSPKALDTRLTLLMSRGYSSQTIQQNPAWLRYREDYLISTLDTRVLIS